MISEQFLAFVVACVLLVNDENILFMCIVILCCLLVIAMGIAFCCKYQRISTGLFCKYYCGCFYGCCSEHCEKKWIKGQDPIAEPDVFLNPYGVEEAWLHVAPVVYVTHVNPAPTMSMQPVIYPSGRTANIPPVQQQGGLSGAAPGQVLYASPHQQQMQMVQPLGTPSVIMMPQGMQQPPPVQMMPMSASSGSPMVFGSAVTNSLIPAPESLHMSVESASIGKNISTDPAPSEGFYFKAAGNV